jgi:murein DD-endopeptidase MepM/ murein hydrolase activator NlpD
MPLKKITLLIIPEGSRATKQLRVPTFVFPFSFFLISILAFTSGYVLYDYINLIRLKELYIGLNVENNALKGEARLLMDHLEEVKRSLQKVQDYSTKLGELTRVRVEKVSQKTGIEPLNDTNQLQNKVSGLKAFDDPGHFIPPGLNIDSLHFKPVLGQLAILGEKANQNALELQQLLSSLSQQRSILQSIPSVSPVDGWITSGFGSRVSPFTGENSQHMGLDIAAPPGTPVMAPADGVVIFSGQKEGFGNFVMIAHGYGIITRYGHNEQNIVHPGQKVIRGEQIATVGSSGRTTGPHVHYEIQVNGQYEDPQKFILDPSDLRLY